jgi:hypothetical protein
MEPSGYTLNKKITISSMMKGILLLVAACLCSVDGWSVLKALKKHHLHKKRVMLSSVLGAAAAPSTAELNTMKDAEAAARKAVAQIRGPGYNSKVKMAEDPGAVAAIKTLQGATEKLLVAQYGKFLTKGGQPGHKQGQVIRIKMDITFPDKMPDNAAKGKDATITIETAPLDQMPHAVKVFLDIVNGWQGGAFHRNAGHVLQITTSGRLQGLTFQEYSVSGVTLCFSNTFPLCVIKTIMTVVHLVYLRARTHANTHERHRALLTAHPFSSHFLFLFLAFPRFPPSLVFSLSLFLSRSFSLAFFSLAFLFSFAKPEFPHVPGTLGYAGRLGGPAFYISTIDNSRNHGPGSQGSTMGEADR